MERWNDCPQPRNCKGIEAVPLTVPRGTLRNDKNNKFMYSIAIILEKRHPRKDGTFAVKLRVTIDRYSRYFGLGYSLTEPDFEKAFSLRATGRLKKIANKLREKEKQAETILDGLETPDFDQFTGLFTQRAINKTGTVKRYYDNYIAELTAENRHGTANNYTCSVNSLSKFTNIETLTFKQVTPDFLKRYAAKMLADGKTPSTIGIYLRPLRHLFKKAQSNNEAPKNNPFGIGENKFSIPTGEKNKRPLERTEIEILAAYKCPTPERAMYRDFFLLSYLLSGLNFSDLLIIQWAQIDGQTLTVTRQKTQRTAKKTKKIELFITDQAQQIINRYASPGKYVFDIVDDNDNPKTIREKVYNFSRNSNQALKKIAKATGINKNISPIFARHSAASHGIEAGATIADISAALGHTDLKTTSNYISSLKNGRQKLAESLQIGINPELKPPTNENTNIKTPISQN
jgi:integrase/recombinase XerD